MAVNSMHNAATASSKLGNSSLAQICQPTALEINESEPTLEACRPHRPRYGDGVMTPPQARGVQPSPCKYTLQQT